MIIFDLRDSAVWKNGLSPEAKPRVTDNFSRPPESQKSNIIPVTRGISHYLFDNTSIMDDSQSSTGQKQCKFCSKLKVFEN